MPGNSIAVIGASGVVGRAAIEQLGLAGHSVTGFSRRPPADLPDASFIPLDLMDEAACANAAVRNLKDTTHIVYAALFEKPGLIAGWHEEDQMQTNLKMLQNLLAPLKTSSSLRHITLLQGTKAYGAHVQPMSIPGLERSPRHEHANFYWLQQDYLESFCREASRSLTIWRPQIIIGHALNAPMNLLNAVGIYASLLKSRGDDLVFPGGPGGVTELIDADLLARAILHSFDNQSFNNETFNITNGDVIRWRDIWPAVAGMFDMKVGAPRQQRLSDWIYDCEDEWQAIVEEHGLRPYTIRELAGDSFYYADALFNAYSTEPPPPSLLSTIKLRQAGFPECVDSEVMFQNWFTKLRQLKVLPR